MGWRVERVCSSKLSETIVMTLYELSIYLVFDRFNVRKRSTDKTACNGFYFLRYAFIVRDNEIDYYYVYTHTPEYLKSNVSFFYWNNRLTNTSDMCKKTKNRLRVFFKISGLKKITSIHIIVYEFERLMCVSYIYIYSSIWVIYNVHIYVWIIKIDSFCFVFFFFFAPLNE